MPQSDSTQQLTALICDRIRERGPVTFRWFMEQALYHPQWGYYSAPGLKIGREGDFYTSVSVGPAWGRIMASQFAAAWEIMGRPHGFVIVEQGAHDGRFALDVLSWLRDNRPELFAELTYVIVEPRENLEIEQRGLLTSPFRGKVRWLKGLMDLDTAAFLGVIFCNELLDAFPVHRVVFQQGRWWELFVDLSGPDERLHLSIGEPSVDSLRRQLEIIGPGVEDQLAEVNLKAINWAADAASALRAGLVLAVDYGLPRSELYSPARREGTFRCYHRHRVTDDPFAAIGATDMTCHVDFTSVAESAERGGLRVIGFLDQHHFLVGACQAFFSRVIDNPAELTPELQAELRQVQALMHPATMGMAFHFLAMTKHVPELRNLPGLAFGGDPRQALGLGPPPPDDDYGI